MGFFVYLFLEMKSMEHDSGQLSELQKQKSELEQELLTVQRKLKGIIFMSLVYFADEYNYIHITGSYYYFKLY